MADSRDKGRQVSMMIAWSMAEHDVSRALATSFTREQAAERVLSDFVSSCDVDHREALLSAFGW